MTEQRAVEDGELWIYEPREKRKPCIHCNRCEAFVKTKNNQACAFCYHCKTYLGFNPSKAELGRERSKADGLRENITASQQARIFERAGNRCEQCGVHGSLCDSQGLQVGHFLSEQDAKALGVKREIFNSDDNHLAQCPACNIGQSGRSLSPQLTLAILTARVVRSVDDRTWRKSA